MTMLGLQIKYSEETFKNVIALYTSLVENRQNMRAKQAELNMNGEVTAEPMDFLFDCEMKAKRVLTQRQYTFFRVFSENGMPQLIPVDIQLALGTVWYETKLDIDGPYRSLYFRVKNRMDREHLTVERAQAQSFTLG